MCEKLGLATDAARFQPFSNIAERQGLKRVTQELHESIQAFKPMGAEIELQPILDLASRELRKVGIGNIPTVTRQMMETSGNYQANDNARLISRAFANVPRFL